MIDIDITFWFQLVNFFVTLVILNYLLVAPVRKIIRQRREKTMGLAEEIAGFTAQSQKLLDDYEADLARTRATASLNRKEARAEAEAEERTLLTVASRDAQATLQASQVAVRAEVATARQVLEADLPSLRDAVLAKVLG